MASFKIIFIAPDVQTRHSSRNSHQVYTLSISHCTKQNWWMLAHTEAGHHVSIIHLHNVRPAYIRSWEIRTILLTFFLNKSFTSRHSFCNTTGEGQERVMPLLLTSAKKPSHLFKHSFHPAFNHTTTILLLRSSLNLSWRHRPLHHAAWTS